MAAFTQNSFPASQSPLLESGKWEPIGSSTGVSTDGSGNVKSSTAGWQGTRLAVAEEAFTKIIFVEVDIGTEAGSIGPAAWSSLASGWGGLGATVTAANTLLIREYFDIEDLSAYSTKGEIYPSFDATVSIEMTGVNGTDFEVFADDVSVLTGTVSKPIATTVQPGFIGQNVTTGTLTAITARDSKVAAKSVTPATATPLDGAVQTFTFTGVTGPITAATYAGVDVFAGLSGTNPSAPISLTVDVSLIETATGAPRIGKLSTVSFTTAADGAITTDVTLQPKTGWAVVNLAATLIKTTTTVPPDAIAGIKSILLSIDDTLGITTAIGNQLYFKQLYGETCTPQGLYNGGTLLPYQFTEVIIQQGGSSTTVATSYPGAFYPFGTGAVPPTPDSNRKKRKDRIIRNFYWYREEWKKIEK